MIIINEVISIENKEGTLVVSSREIAEHFNKQHRHILRDIQVITDDLGSAQKWTHLFIESKWQNEQNKQWYEEYLLTRDGFSLLVMGFTGKAALDWKLKYIEAFNKMEATLKEQNNKMLPTTYKEALIQLLTQVEENEKLLEENKVLSPKAEYHDAVLNKDNLISISVIAKDMGLPSATKLNQMLFEDKVIFKEGGVWKPYAKFEWLITDGYADYVSYTTPNSYPLLKWTEKGRKWIIDKYSPQLSVTT